MTETNQQTSDKRDQRAWVLPPYQPAKKNADLTLVPTPIGNLGDITVRALDVLQNADVIVCEDTRVTGKLLNYFDIKDKKLIPYNDHSDDSVRDKIIHYAKSGQSVALVSDAGTPLISDPGYKLVRACLTKEVSVSALPGANAVLPALQLSGFPSDGFVFAGFLPTKDKARKDLLKQWGDAPHPVIFYETAPRLLKTLGAIQAELGNREISVVREISKLYEEARTDTAEALIKYYEEFGAPKGEIVLLMAPQDTQLEAADIDALLMEALKDNRVKEAAKIVAEQTGRPKSELYERALQLKDGV